MLDHVIEFICRFGGPLIINCSREQYEPHARLQVYCSHAAGSKPEHDCCCAGQESDADSGEPELCFNPVSLGKAVEMLPSYLQYEIKFGASQRQTLVGRIMEALGKCKVLQKNIQG